MVESYGTATTVDFTVEDVFDVYSRVWAIRIMHKQSIACDPEDVLSLDFEVVDGLRFVLWLDAKHGGGTGKRG